MFNYIQTALVVYFFRSQPLSLGRPTPKYPLPSTPLSGYGVRAPVDCIISGLLVAVHSLVAVLMESIILGIAFARISHPKNRGRTILVSNCAAISRRDGVLKL